MNLKSVLFGALLAATVASCSSPKTVLPYFTDISEVKEGVLPMADYLPVIKPDDELLITVMSSYPEAAVQYNLPLSNPASKDVLDMAVSPRQQTYVVDTKGDINFPVLGAIHVAGLTTEQLQQELTAKISKDVDDPMVTVTLVNFSVVVAGEVKQPSRLKVTRNRYSLLDAIADAGDLTEYGERSNVLLVREENGERKFVHLDLNSSDVLTSPYFYLKQNDYIYVEPNAVRQANSKYNQNNAFKLTVVSTIVSAASVIASLVIALTIK